MLRSVRSATQDRVVSGPFQGLAYIHRAVGSVHAAKLLGTYEKELASVIDQIIARGYPLVIDIGAAEGYYAVGLARRIPNCRVIAFEAQVRQHPVLRSLARNNQVDDRITLHGFGTTQSLCDAMAQRPADSRVLLICDVEGFQEELLDPSAVPELIHADVLVELHEFARPGITTKLRERFAKTHRITEIHTRARTLEDFPPGVELDPALKLSAMHESRPGEMAWFWMDASPLA